MTTKKLLVTLFLLFIISWPSYSSAQRGCCSWHGGVCGCDTSTGSQLCCDGTDSPSCGCQYIPPKPKPSPAPTPKPATPASTFNPINNSDPLQSKLDQVNSDLTKCNNSATDKDKQISDKNSEISKLKADNDSQSGWLGFLVIALIVSVVINFYKSKN
jgi:hypothetical protein